MLLRNSKVIDAILLFTRENSFKVRPNNSIISSYLQAHIYFFGKASKDNMSLAPLVDKSSPHSWMRESCHQWGLSRDLT